MHWMDNSFNLHSRVRVPGTLLDCSRTQSERWEGVDRFAINVIVQVFTVPLLLFRLEDINASRVALVTAPMAWMVWNCVYVGPLMNKPLNPTALNTPTVRLRGNGPHPKISAFLNIQVPLPSRHHILYVNSPLLADMWKHQRPVARSRGHLLCTSRRIQRMFFAQIFLVLFSSPLVFRNLVAMRKH